MLLVVDVGNTNTVVGVYEGEVLRQHWRIETRQGRTADEYGLLLLQLLATSGIETGAVRAGIVSCVVPPVLDTLCRAVATYLRFELMVVGRGIRTGMAIRYENPREVGADRIVNAVAAYERCRGPAIVVDFGTATTFDAVSADGAYLGGAIAPGVAISTEALFRHASKLPRIELVPPRNIIGRNTVESMQAGFLYGYVGLVDGVVERMKAEMPPGVRVLATGGLAATLSAESRTVDEVLPMLTLEGLRILHARNEGE